MDTMSKFVPLKRAMVALLLLAVSAGLTGCGYSSKELFPTDYRTVAAPSFDNRTFYRGVEFELAEAMVKQIESRTPYKVVAPATAQTMLEGTITDIKQNQLSRRRPGGVPQEIELTVTVDFVWKDLVSGEVIRDRRGFVAVGRHTPTAGIGEPFEVAQHQAVQRLARDIVSTMRSDW
jgi:Lipopolysaccharide-assembly